MKKRSERYEQPVPPQGNTDADGGDPAPSSLDETWASLPPGIGPTPAEQPDPYPYTYPQQQDPRRQDARDQDPHPQDPRGQVPRGQVPYERDPYERDSYEQYQRPERDRRPEQDQQRPEQEQQRPERDRLPEGYQRPEPYRLPEYPERQGPYQERYGEGYPEQAPYPGRSPERAPYPEPPGVPGVPGRRTGPESGSGVPAGVEWPEAPQAGTAAPETGPAPGPVPGPAGDRDGGAGPDRTATTVPTLGAPRHSGPKPPLYAPHPGRLPSVRDDLDAAVLPDIVVDGATYPGLTVRAASVRGDSHRYESGPRQDSLCVARLGGPGEENGLLLLAVADGVGSAARSHVGSQDVCRRIALFLDPYADEVIAALRAGDRPALGALVNSAVGSAAEGLTQRVTQRGGRPAEHATTLRGLLVPLDPELRERAWFTVGDGGAALLRDGVWDTDVFGEEQVGSGVIDTGTAALPGSRLARSGIHGPAAPGDVFVLSTDGLSTPLAGDAGMRDFLAAAWGQGEVPGPVDFLWQFQYRVKSYDDDRTAVCLWEDPAGRRDTV
ncbi:protein phosphatase 2C domain-containing protein [Streptomyces uncialis]|uniref:protein phosphatase 2C domain-containing protein n=1 Tax=Streptomyces uncialis TaxID=1048205 RepID=UPI00225AA007|nr:protein phosphatase 2C domain-containing protein [Streptomyces uncialis]MCX4661341.1 protein phosphatase 2C domain-containing protein [Streptomyces uncialis]